MNHRVISLEKSHYRKARRDRGSLGRPCGILECLEECSLQQSVFTTSPTQAYKHGLSRKRVKDWKPGEKTSSTNPPVAPNLRHSGPCIPRRSRSIILHCPMLFNHDLIEFGGSPVLSRPLCF